MTSPQTILIVDDVPANLGLLFEALTEAGYRALVAESGESALAQLDHEIPDMILLDYMLPGLDGIEVCKRLKKRPDCADVPVLFLTAVTEVEEKVRALEAGAVDYVTKPIQATEVLARVRTHLRISTLHKSLQEEIAMRREAEEQLRDSLDRALLVAAADGKIHFATRLAQTLLTRFFADRAADHLPNPLQSLLNGSGTTPSLPHGFEAKLLRPASADEMGVLELNCHDAPKPAILLNLGLTPREAEVLFWMSEGKTNGEIGIILSSARRTVEKHVERILEKLGVENRAAASRTALGAMGFAA